MIQRSCERTRVTQAGEAALWAKPRGNQVQPHTKRRPSIARLTITVTSDLRARITIAAFERGNAGADMRRLPLPKDFARTNGRSR
jgi:hypothetical protein